MIRLDLPKQVYFDCNATTPVLPAAADAAFEAMQTLYGNPSSLHRVGMQAKLILESVRDFASKAIGAESAEQIIFTSGATEAVQTAVFSALYFLKNRNKELCLQEKSHEKSTKESEDTPHVEYGGRRKLLYGATEHKVVPEALHHWVRILDLPFEVIELPVDDQGQIRLDVLKNELDQTALLCTMAVNNETGVIQNLSAIQKMISQSKLKPFWLVDCVQALGKSKLDLQSSGIDYAVFSGHKLYAPKGVGFLYARRGAPLLPLIVGGGQEKGFRSGTENLPGLAALKEVLKELLQSEEKDPSERPVFHSEEKLKDFRKRLILELQGAFPKILFNAPLDHCVPTTLNFSIPGFTSAELLELFDTAGLRLSSGSACSSATAVSSHVLNAMGLPAWRSNSAIRLSFGPCTTESEVERGCDMIREVANALRNTCLIQTAGAFEAPASLRDGVIQFRSGSANSWIVAHRETKQCVVLDPCDLLAERIESYIRCQGLRVLAIVDTHSHAKHDSIRPVLQKILKFQMAAPLVSFDSLGWPLSENPFAGSVTLANGEKVPAIKVTSQENSELVLARYHTPGHTSDSQTYLYGWSESGVLKKDKVQFVFCGDTILSGELGKTCFDTSCPETLYHSLKKLNSVIHESSLLCPSHDYQNSFATCLKTELSVNALLALALSSAPSSVDSAEVLDDVLKDTFVRKKREADQFQRDLEETSKVPVQLTPCGLPLDSKATETSPISLSQTSLIEELNQRANRWKVIDVREAQEFELTKDWSRFGIEETPRNVPLSRFVNFMGEVLAQEKEVPGFLLLCRSGTRSLHAAKSLRRLGVTQVWSLEGGVALL